MTDESVDEGLDRFREEERWSGFGALSDSGISDGIDDAHRNLEDELRRDIDELTG